MRRSTRTTNTTPGADLSNNSYHNTATATSFTSTTPAAAVSVGSLLAEEILINPTSFLPSFLELKLVQVASDFGRASLKRFLSTTIGNSLIYPLAAARLAKFFNFYSSEISVLVTYIVEKRFLNLYCATFMEYFMYGLKRSKVTSKGNITDLTNKDKIRCALMVSLLPYVKEKISALFLQQMPSSSVIVDDGVLSKWKHRLQFLFIKIYPFLHFALEGTLLAYQWAYLFGRSVYYSPDLHFLNVIPRRVTLEDISPKNHQQQNSPVSKPPPINSSYSSSWNPSSKLALGLFLSRCLFRINSIIRQNRQHRAMAAFISDSAKHSNFISSSCLIYPAPVPPPFLSSDQQQQLVVVPGICPLCNQIPVNPSASPSGYVFCFKCLVIYVRDHDGLCPFNGPCSEDQIIRLN